MKALSYSKFGECTEVMQVKSDVPVPTLQSEGDVLLKVQAASLNPADLKHTQGQLKHLVSRPFPILVGFDVSGTVEQVGKEVEASGEFQVGDEVFGMIRGLRTGTVAEYVVVHSKVLAKKPSNLTHAQAAAAPLAAITAINCFEEAGMELGKGNSDGGKDKVRVAITGGAGGVGVFAIQIAKKMFNAGYVVTTASPGEKTDLVKNLGADEVVNYREISLTDAFLQRPVEERFDVIMDCNDEAADLAKILKPGGCVVSLGKRITSKMLKKWVANADPNGPKVSSVVSTLVHTPLGAVTDLFSGAYSTNRSAKSSQSGGQGGRYAAIITVPDKRIMNALAEALGKGDIEAVIDSTYSLDDAMSAVKKLHEGHAKGKVVVEMN